ncbi:hypothetical protein [Roseovarius sp. SYSU LYC5161]|jgi:hypothetical protein|uniref:hypothetical protein n=1 Tax=Roseovarius halophilus (ex Wu et al. 2025) TaxID=3376060 RepID=UPI002870F581|nr:hypothetical protein [Roseovarius sp.]
MIVVVGLIVAFILIVIFSNPRTRACRWREDRRHPDPGKTRYRCMACGAVTATTNGKPPKDCHAERRT